LWSFDYPLQEEALPIAKVGHYGVGKDICIISYANGLWMSLRVAKKLEAKGIHSTVVDIRWLNPIPEEDLLAKTKDFSHILIVDECRKTGGISEAILCLLAEHRHGPHIKRICGTDTYIPLGAAANLVLIQEEDIEQAAHSLLENNR
jgi:2-oxoisovalerate dehydrogenase E1 component